MKILKMSNRTIIRAGANIVGILTCILCLASNHLGDGENYAHYLDISLTCFLVALSTYKVSEFE